MDQTTTTADRKDDWDHHWNLFATGATLNPAQQMRYKLISHIIGESASSRSSMRVCDIGSGQGDLIALLSRTVPSAEFVGLELSNSGVEISRKKAKSARFYVEDVFSGNPNALGLNHWATDAVCSEVLEHVDDPVAFLRAARAYLAPGASLVVTVPGGPMSQFDKYIGHRTHFTRASIKSVLENAGFEVKRTTLAGFPFFNLYRLTVILSGKRLINAVRSDGESETSLAARVAMRIYNFLFRFNFNHSALGWQVIAVAVKRE